MIYGKGKHNDYESCLKRDISTLGPQELHNLINDVKSLSPRYLEYQANVSKKSRPSSKMASGSQHKNYDSQPSMATMMYKNFVMSPSNAKSNDKIMKKKKEAHKSKGNHGNSKMMKSGSMSNIYQNNSISDSASKKKSLTRQKTSGALKNMPYTISQKMLKNNTSSTMSPTIAMFN